MKAIDVYAGIVAVAVSTACVAAYPDKPVRLIVGVPAGGTPDVMARMVTPGLSELLGQQIVVDNRGGAGGMIGADLVAHAPSDGYTLLMTSPGALTIQPHLHRKMAYDPLKDLAPIGVVSIGPFLLIAHPAVPAKTVKALIALAKAQPGKLDYASAGSGTPNHLAMELFKSMAGIDINHVPYKGAPQAVTDVLAGQVGVMFNSIAPVLPHIRSGRVRALGIGSSKRSTVLPDIPTINESGVPGYEAVSWFGMLAPANTPSAIVTQLNKALMQVIHRPEIRKQLEGLGSEPLAGSPEEFGALMRRESARYAKVVKSSGAKVD
jgi:tripartite-type tricarboxylate transporter receptor subunit TctC